MNDTSITVSLIAYSRDFCIDEVVFHCHFLHIVSGSLLTLGIEHIYSTKGSLRDGIPCQENTPLTINPLDNRGYHDSLSGCLAMA